MLEYRLCLLLQLWCLTVIYLYVRVSSFSPSTIVMFWRSCICMLEYRLCLLLQLWCLTVMYLYVRVSFLPPSTIVMFDGHVFCMLEYRLCLLLQLWCLTVMYLYVGVSSLPLSTIVMFDGHAFVSWGIVFASFNNCDVWRSCICMLEYCLCLLLLYHIILYTSHWSKIQLPLWITATTRRSLNHVGIYYLFKYTFKSFTKEMAAMYGMWYIKVKLCK